MSIQDSTQNPISTPQFTLIGAEAAEDSCWVTHPLSKCFVALTPIIGPIFYGLANQQLNSQYLAAEPSNIELKLQLFQHSYHYRVCLLVNIAAMIALSIVAICFSFFTPLAVITTIALTIALFLVSIKLDEDHQKIQQIYQRIHDAQG
ncbi:MAG: hypothetical protein FJZ56_07380 [Chlamydiae bacterium]|nr:hypothetical protein [Chlamydiota bacterium]